MGKTDKSRDKSQRPISSFFFSQPKASPGSQGKTVDWAAGATARDEAEKSNPHQRAAAEKRPDPPPAPPDDDPAEKPAKRARAEASSLKPVLSIPPMAKQPPSQATLQGGQVVSQAQEAAIDLDSDEDVQTVSEMPGEQAQDPGHTQVHIPGRVDKRHIRFQNKLVNGTGGRRARGADGIVAQKHTPLELQVLELKQKYPGVLLIIEVGYKMRFFGEDAEVAAKECNIFSFPDRNFMTASVPVPRLHVYVRRLVAAGHKVGVVRQIETAALKAAGDNRYAPFQRKLTALYTRSTIEAGDKGDIGEGTVGSGSGNASWSNEGLSSYLVCLAEKPGPSPTDPVDIGIVAVDPSIGGVLYDEFRDDMMRGGLEARLMFAAPSELLVAQPVSNATQRLLGAFSTSSRGMRAESVGEGLYDGDDALTAITSFYQSGESSGNGALETVQELPPLVLRAFAHAVDYLKPFGLEGVLRLSSSFRRFSQANEITLSPNALRQLEVLRNSDDGGERGSLLWLMDHTKTAMGGRLMRSWVAHPLRSLPLINDRLDAVQELAGDSGEEGGELGALRGCLSALPDLERGITRMLHRTAAPSEFLVTLRAFSTVAADLRIKVADGGKVRGVNSSLLQRLLAAAAAAEVGESARELLSLVDASAAEQNDKIALFTSQERFSAVFACRRAVADCEAILEGLLPQLAKRFRIPRLEYKGVQNQGDYLIEVPSERTDVPKEWEKIAGTKKVSRYRPPEVRDAVKELEIARERLQAAAEQAWLDFLGEFAALYTPFRAAVSALANLDTLQSLALVANNSGYVRPEFAAPSELPQLLIKGGRHPVLDAVLETAVVPNDTRLGGGDGPTAAIITGPNMGGKSCYIRQAALIAIMAQVGSLVPAESVRLRAIDAVHTRMGASDNLAQGRSTFLEELSETSTILAEATESSLVILDELGRGTSTHDGLAIAHATLQHLVHSVKALTLFVTHFPKVASLQQQFPGRVDAKFMSYLQEGATASSPLPLAERSSTQASGPPSALPKVTFLYRLVPGVADCSFGLNVAHMAHLPETVIHRAALKAAQMEEDALLNREDVEGAKKKGWNHEGDGFGLESMQAMLSKMRGFLQMDAAHAAVQLRALQKQALSAAGN